MKKITFTLIGLLFSIVTFAQAYSTGPVPFFEDYEGKIDVTASTVTLTLVGPSTSWLGVGFNASAMDANSDLVIFDGSTVSDRRFNGFQNTPLIDAVQNWAISSNVVNTGMRTVVLTRSRVASDAGDFTFSFAVQSLNLVFARSVGSTVVQYHGSGNCGATTVNFTLGTESFSIANFKVYPNPSNSYTIIELPDSINEARVSVYDFLGRVVKKQNITITQNRIDTSNLQKGSYIIEVSTNEGFATKTLVIN